MKNLVIVFNTKEQADILQERDFQAYLETIENHVIKEITTAWDIPRQKSNGQWTYFIYPHADYTGYTLEEYDENNYYQE